MEKGYKVQGVKVNYYCICKRKLWLFSKGITMEQDNDRVLQGKVLHEHSYPRERYKEVMIDDLLKVDMIDEQYVKEIKISSRMEMADKMQLYYYLYYLKQKGINKKGKLNYVKEKRVEEIELTEDMEESVIEILDQIEQIEKQKKPPQLNPLSYCKKCAYYEFCYAKEE